MDWAGAATTPGTTLAGITFGNYLRLAGVHSRHGMHTLVSLNEEMAKLPPALRHTSSPVLCRTAFQRKNCSKPCSPMLIALVRHNKRVPRVLRVKCRNALFATTNRDTIVRPLEASYFTFKSSSLARVALAMHRDRVMQTADVYQKGIKCPTWLSKSTTDMSTPFVGCLKGADDCGARLHASPSKGSHWQRGPIGHPQILRAPRKEAQFRLHAPIMHAQPPPAALHFTDLFSRSG